jgi:16S rRNA (cytidine1402-2'-O)-methyltransferase
VEIIPIPGPTALVTAASICGFPMDKFQFFGFPPAKNKRRKFFQEVSKSKHPVILYESSHRILKTLQELNNILNTRLVVCRELTKMFEKTYRGTIVDVFDKMKNQDLRGEFVIIIGNQKHKKDE